MKGRILLVTGGNRGIGLAIVKGLSENKEDTVLLGCRDLKEGKKIAKTIGENVQAVELNLTTSKSIQKGISYIKSHFQSVDVLLNNAGVLNEGSLLEVHDEKFEENFQVNTLAPYQLIRAFVPDMIHNGYGRIVNISSGLGSFKEGLLGPSFAYSFSKVALNALTVILAKDLPKKAKNIKVNSMCPGWVRTRMGGKEAKRSPEKGAETALWLSNLPSDGPSGQFYRDKKSIHW